MPTYQYSCTECDHFFEQFQSFSEESLTVCPACEGRLRKVFNAVGVVFKGSGFYRTDSRAANGSNGGSGEKVTAGSSAPGGSSTSGSGEKASTGSSSAGSSSAGSSSASPAGTAAAGSAA